jgi:hypothetical protein
MKKIATTLALLALLSCRDDTVKPLNGTEITTEPSADSVDAGKVKAISKEKLEDEIIVLQKNITNSTPADRKSLLLRYLSYRQKVDGAIAESYFAYAFDYEQNKSKDFYSALSATDTAFVRQWAEAAAFEAGLGIETQSDAEAFFQDLQHNNESKAAILNAGQKQLFDLYHRKMEQAALKTLQE